jgi:hypothetical protein
VVNEAWERVKAGICQLCEAARITAWHHEDDVCWVADCEICGVPMVVWRQHGTAPADDVRAHMVDRLSHVAAGRWGAHGFTLDPHMRQIPDHFHVHARPIPRT